MSDEESSGRHVCPQCFGDASLKQRVREMQLGHASEKCDIHVSEQGVPIGAVAKIIDEVFRQSFCFDPDGDDLQTCLFELTNGEDAVTEALVLQLVNDEVYLPQNGEEPFYDADEPYRRGDFTDAFRSLLWSGFCDRIVHDQRFFNLRARDTLNEIFAGLHRQLDRFGKSPVYRIEPGQEDSKFYRARVFDRGTSLRAIAKDVARYVGPPPERQRRAGRLNPAGVPAFYGAFDLDTCISELRPAVGNIVVGAQFEITEPLCALDITRFQNPQVSIDLFAKDQVRLTAQWRFMVEFMHEISRPITPDDEHLDYVPTQAVAEYLLNHYNFDGGGDTRTIEAIIYGSAQRPGSKNIVLLGAAARVRVLEPDNTATGEEPVSPELSLKAWLLENDRFRLAVKPCSLEARIITGASFSSERYGI